jgi:hypothetical protein
MRLLAEYLVRWCESEIAAGKVLAKGDDNQHRDHDAYGKPKPSRNNNRQQDQRAG